MQPKPIRVGAWELHHHVLKPSRCLLQTHAVRLHAALQRPHDFVTFVCSSHPPTPHPPPDDAAAGRVTIHRVLLDAAGVPLRSLVSGPFKEASANTITVHERFDSFEVVRKFLYCEPINMDIVPSELPLVADRWGLTTLFRACFTHAEERARAHNDTPRIHVAELVSRFLPIMAIVDVPSRFKTYIAMRMAIEMRDLNAYFRDNPVHIPPLCRDAICSLRHTDGVQCRRKKSAILTDDVIPATHISNPSAQPVPDTLDSQAKSPSAAREQPHDAELPNNPENTHASPEHPARSEDEPPSKPSPEASETSKQSPDNQAAVEDKHSSPQGEESQPSQNGHLGEGESAEASTQYSATSTSSSNTVPEGQEGDCNLPSPTPATVSKSHVDDCSNGPPPERQHSNEGVDSPELQTTLQPNAASSSDAKASAKGATLLADTGAPVLNSHHDQSSKEEDESVGQVTTQGEPSSEQDTPCSTVQTESMDPMSGRTEDEATKESVNATEEEYNCHKESSTNNFSAEQREEQSPPQACAEKEKETTAHASQGSSSALTREGAAFISPAEGMEETSPEASGEKPEPDETAEANHQPDEGNTNQCEVNDTEQLGPQSNGVDVPASAPSAEGDGSGDEEASEPANAEGGAEASASADAHSNSANEVDGDANADAHSDASANAGDEADGDANAEANSNADDNSIADVESVVADSASVAASEEADLPVYEIDPSESEPKEWHKTFDVWNVFHQRNMLDDVIHYMCNYGCDNYMPLLLDVILKQLEPCLSDDEILRFLRKCDWVWEAPAFTVLSDLGKNWDQRAWRLLACARTGYYGEGKEYQMFWNFKSLAGAIRSRATEVANKGSDSDSESSHSSAPDDGFAVQWGQKVADDEFEFTMSLNVSDVGEPWDDLSPLYLTIRLLEKDDSGTSPENAKRKVTARVNVIESGCGCVLGGDAPRIGSIASSSDGTLICSLIDGFRFLNGNRNVTGGNSYSIMNGQVLKSWLDRHNPQCGLAFHVRLYVAPRDENSSDTGSESSDELVDCTCGYCECTGCEQASEEEKHSNYNSDDENGGGSGNENDS